MADLVAGDVTYTLQNKAVLDSGMRQWNWKIAFGDGADTYPSGGVPLAKASMGCPTEIQSLQITDPASANGYVYKYDFVNNKVRIYNSAAATDGSRIYNWAVGVDMKGATNPAGTEGAADAAAAPVNSTLVATAATFTAMAGTVTVAASPDVPRNLMLTVLNDSGGALNLYEGDTTYSVTGTFRGAAQTEDIVWTSTAGNKEIANTKYRYIEGTKPFDTVTAITYDNAAAGDLKLSVGIGSRLGYPVDSDTGAEADFQKATIDAADYTISSVVDVTNKTFDVDTTADGADVVIQYVVDFDTVSASALAEFSGSPAATVLYAEVIGW